MISEQIEIELLTPEAESPGPGSLVSASQSRVTVSSDPPLFQPDACDDSETSEMVAVAAEYRRVLLLREREIEMLELTKEQLEEMAEDRNELAKDEYFDLQYLKAEARKCWAGRMETDPTTQTTSPRLFKGDPALRVLSQESSMEEMQRSHPLMFRRMERNRARRALFNRSMESQLSNDSTRNTSATPLLLSDIRSRVMAAPALHRASAAATQPPIPSHQKKRGTLVKASDVSSEALHIVAGDIVEGKLAEETSTKPPTLSEMLRQQKAMLEETNKRDVEVYQPLLASFIRYEDFVQQRLEELGLPEPSDPSADTQKPSGFDDSDGSHVVPPLRL